MSGGVDFIMNFLAGRDTISPKYYEIAQAQAALINAGAAAGLGPEQLSVKLQELGAVTDKTDDEIRQLSNSLVAASPRHQELAASIGKVSMRQLELNAQMTHMELTLRRNTLASAIRVAQLSNEEGALESATISELRRQVMVAESADVLARERVEVVKLAAAQKIATDIGETYTAETAQKAAVTQQATQATSILTVAEQKRVIAERIVAVETAKATLEDHKKAMAAGVLNAVEELVTLNKLERALATEREALSEAKATLATIRHKEALEQLVVSGAKANHWLGISMAGSIEKMGKGARLTGFDIGFMAFHLANIGMVAATATAALNVLADEASSVEQLRFGVENLGMSWSEVGSSIEAEVQRLRDATGNTDIEIREIMGALAAVGGGLINTQDEMIAHTNLVLDLMRRSGKDMNLASRIVTRTAAGNLESLRELFPALTAEIDRMRDAGLSLEELGDWGLEQLRQRVSGAASAISDAERVVATMRNSVIEAAQGIGSLFLPAFQMLATVVRPIALGLKTVGELIDILGAAVPIVAVGIIALTRQTWLWYAALVAVQSISNPVVLIIGALAAIGLAVGLFSESSENAAEAAAQWRRDQEELNSALSEGGNTLERLNDLMATGDFTYMQYLHGLQRIRQEAEHLQQPLIAFEGILGRLGISRGFSGMNEWVQWLREIGVRADATNEQLADLLVTWAEFPPQPPEDFGWNMMLPAPGDYDTLEEFNQQLAQLEQTAAIESARARMEEISDRRAHLIAVSDIDSMSEDARREYNETLAELGRDYVDQEEEIFDLERQALIDAETERLRLREEARRNGEQAHREAIRDAQRQARELAEAIRDAAREQIDAMNERASKLWLSGIHEQERAREQALVGWQSYLDQSSLAQLRHIDASLANQGAFYVQWQMAHAEFVERNTEVTEQDLAAQAAARAAWTEMWQGSIGVMQQWGAVGKAVIEEETAAKQVGYFIDAVAQLGYAAANWYNPYAVSQHLAAATTLFIAAGRAMGEKPTQRVGGGGGGGADQARHDATRRRQSLEAGPDQSLRSPSGLTFVIMNDNRGALGLEGERLGMQIMGVVNRSGRYGSGRRLNNTVLPVWRG